MAGRRPPRGRPRPPRLAQLRSDLPPVDTKAKDDFSDVWEELECSGHNLTSVLSNPRETMLDVLYEVFDPEQHWMYAGEGEPHREVDISNLEAFMRKTSKLAAKFQRNHKKGALEGVSTPQMGTPTSVGATGGSSSLDAIPTVGTPSGIAPKPMVFVNMKDTADVEGDVRRCKDKVPPCFFLDDYSLKDEHTFDTMVNNGRADQHEILAQYLDAVEVCLLKQISSRSDAFFEGLQTTHILKQQVAEACTSVQQLRQCVKMMEVDVVAKAMKVPQLAQRQRNLVALQEILTCMQQVQQSHHAISALLAAEDYSAAIEIMQSARDLYDTQLAGLHALDHVPKQLNDYEDLITDLLSAKFVSLAVDTVEISGAENGQVVDSVSQTDAVGLEAEGFEGDGGELTLEAVLAGLKSLNRVDEVLDVYNKRLINDVKLVIRTVVGDYLNTTDADGVLVDTFDFEELSKGAENGKGQSVGKLKTLDHEAFTACLAMCFEHMLMLLSGASKVYKVVGNNQRSEECLKHLNDLVEKSVGQLLSVRKECHASRLEVEQMKHLRDLTSKFTLDVGELTGFHGQKVEGIILGQARAFMEKKHERQKSTLLGQLDGERWTQVDVSEQRQAMIDALSSGGVLIGYAGLAGEAAGRKGLKKDALVAGVKYKVVWSALLAVTMVTAQLHLVSYFPTLAKDAASRIAELLRLYNSHATQLVLGAGALHSEAKLKSITAKHLALCCQSLGFLRAVLPCISAALHAMLPPMMAPFLTEMDRVNQDLMDHQEKILAKFATIISDMVKGSSESLKTMKWDELEEGEYSSFVLEASKGVTSMHRVLQQHLPREQLMAAFDRIYSVLGQQLPQVYLEYLEGSEDRAAKELRHLGRTLSTLPGVDSSKLSSLEETFR